MISLQILTARVSTLHDEAVGHSETVALNVHNKRPAGALTSAWSIARQEGPLCLYQPYT